MTPRCVVDDVGMRILARAHVNRPGRKDGERGDKQDHCAFHQKKSTSSGAGVYFFLRPHVAGFSCSRGWVGSLLPEAVPTVKQWSLPNQISLGRLCICGLFVGDVSVPWAYSATTALCLFALGSLTDWVDGWIARRNNLVSDLGKLLDPLADKILICAAFLLLLERGFVPLWAVVIIMAREFLVTGLRALIAARGAVLAAASSGKWKTLAQMVYVLLVLTQMALAEVGGDKGAIARILEVSAAPLLWLAVGITFVSGVLYFYRCRAMIFSGETVKEGREEGLGCRPCSSSSGKRMARP